MADNFDDILEKVYQWVGQQLSSCPVQDGITFYHNSDKVFKVVRQRNIWYLQFCVPVPERTGLIILTREEARTKKLGKARWIYKGNSDQEAETLIRSALAGLAQRRLIEPAMSRDITKLCEATCPCYKKMERIIDNKILSPEIIALLQQAYDFLQKENYINFVVLLDKTIEKIADFLLEQQNIEVVLPSLKEKIVKLADLKVISKTLKEDVDVVFVRRDYENSVQERAYPMALMIIAFMSKLLKSCA